MHENDLKISSTKQIILGTYEMAQEGLDICDLNVVIFCTPRSTIKQSIGRILRKEVYDDFPIAVDIVDRSNYIFSNQSNSRAKYYAAQSYNIQDFDVSDYDSNEYDMWNDTAFIKKTLSMPPSKKKYLRLKKNNI